MCVVLAGIFVTLPVACRSVLFMIALLQHVVVGRVARFAYGLEPYCIVACDVWAIDCSMVIRTRPMLEADAAVRIRIRRVSQTVARL